MVFPQACKSFLKKWPSSHNTRFSNEEHRLLIILAPRKPFEAASFSTANFLIHFSLGFLWPICTFGCAWFVPRKKVKMATTFASSSSLFSGMTSNIASSLQGYLILSSLLNNFQVKSRNIVQGSTKELSSMFYGLLFAFDEVPRDQLISWMRPSVLFIFPSHRSLLTPGNRERRCCLSLRCLEVSFPIDILCSISHPMGVKISCLLAYLKKSVRPLPWRDFHAGNRPCCWIHPELCKFSLHATLFYVHLCSHQNQVRSLDSINTEDYLENGFRPIVHFGPSCPSPSALPTALPIIAAISNPQGKV